jgi:hypothetical protein
MRIAEPQVRDFTRSKPQTMVSTVPKKIKEDIIDYMSMTIPSLCIIQTKNEKEETIDYLLDIDNYSKEEFEQGVEAHKWWLITLLNFGIDEEVKNFVSNTSVSIPFLLKKAVERLESDFKIKLDAILNVLNYLPIYSTIQLDSTLNLFGKESVLSIGEYENELIIASETHCHVIDTRKISIQTLNPLFSNRVNAFYQAEKTLAFLKEKKVLMANKIFDVMSAYKLIFAEDTTILTEEEIDKKINEQIGNYSERDKAIKKTQYVLKVRKDLITQIKAKNLVKEATELFKSVSEKFTIEVSTLELAKKLTTVFDGEIIESATVVLQ